MWGWILVKYSVFQSTHPVRGATPRPEPRPPNFDNFNPRTPCGVRPLRDTVQRRTDAYFNPRTPCGVRLCSAGESRAVPAYFNPRTPCGVRRHRCRKTGSSPSISIHAPRAGCDCSTFQMAGRRPISIHAPRAGCDWDIVQYFHKVDQISIHAPRAGCDQHDHRVNGAATGISIHAPRAGCDWKITSQRGIMGISIHAPRAGCDDERVSGRVRPPADFNPRTPCGVRPFAFCWLPVAVLHFNPRTPCGVRRYGHHHVLQHPPISIHAPRAGCDYQLRRSRKADADFNPRTPCGVRLRFVLLPIGRQTQFQSTHPVRGATDAQVEQKND